MAATAEEAKAELKTNVHLRGKDEGITKALLAEKADLVEAEVTDEKTRRNQS